MAHTHKELEISLHEHRPISLIYLDKQGTISQRIVQVNQLHPEEVRVYCLTKKAPRTLRRDQILAASIQTPHSPRHPHAPSFPAL